VKKRRVGFGLLIELPELFVISRVHGPDDLVVLSFDCSYQWHRVSLPERTAPPDWEETPPQIRDLHRHPRGSVKRPCSGSTGREFLSRVHPRLPLGNCRPGCLTLRQGGARARGSSDHAPVHH
jgi:hypothetical protein